MSLARTGGSHDLGGMRCGLVVVSSSLVLSGGFPRRAGSVLALMSVYQWADSSMLFCCRSTRQDGSVDERPRRLVPVDLANRREDFDAWVLTEDGRAARAFGYSS